MSIYLYPIPRPVREIIVNTWVSLSISDQREKVKRLAKLLGKEVGLSLPSFLGGRELSNWARRPYLSGVITKNLLTAFSRTSLAALGVFAMYKLGGSMLVSAAIGSAISLPAVAIAGGSLLAYQGITLLAASILAGSSASVGSGAALLVGGLLILENHDRIKFGIAEIILRAVRRMDFRPTVASDF